MIAWKKGGEEADGRWGSLFLAARAYKVAGRAALKEWLEYLASSSPCARSGYLSFLYRTPALYALLCLLI